MPPGPPPRPPHRLVGLRAALQALRNLGALGGAPTDDPRLTPVIADDGQPIPVRALGTAGPAIVLVHGLGCSHRHWLPVGGRLARQARVFAWDARGHGRCVPRTASRVTLERLAADLAALLDHFALERAVLVGHSMGALTVLRYLQDHGNARVQAVALVDQSPRVVTDDDWRLGLFGGCSAQMLAGAIAGARQDLPGTVARELEAAAGDWLKRREPLRGGLARLLQRWLGGFDAAPLLDLAESLAQADFRPLLPRLPLPLWVALGAQSPHYGNVPLAGYYRAAVPHAQVTMFERSGHSPHVAEPARFARELLRFVADHA